MEPLPLRARLYVIAVTSLAVPLLLLAMQRGLASVDKVSLVSLALLYVLSDSIGSKGSRDAVTIALGSVSAMAALPLLGAWGTIILACSTALATDSRPMVKRLFNTAQLVLAAGASAATFQLLGGSEIHDQSFPYLIWPFLAALIVHCFVNGALVAGIVHFAQGISLRTVWHGTISNSVTGYVGYGLFGLLLAVLWAPEGADVGPAAALLNPQADAI